MKKLIILLYSIPVFLFCQVYTLDEIISISLDNNIDYYESQINYNNSKSTLTSRYLDLLPEATVSAGKNYNLKKDINSRYVGLSASKSIYLNDPTYFGIKDAEINKTISKISENNTKREVIFNVINKYLNIVELEQSIEIQEKNLELKKKSHNKILAKLETGDATIIDKQNSEITLLDYEIALKEARSNLKNARREIFTYINTKDKGYKLEKPEFSLDSFNFDYTKPISLKISELQLKAAKRSLFQSQLNFFPIVSINGNYNYSYKNTGKILDTENYDDSYGISLNFSYPIFNFPEHGKSYSRQKHNLRIQELRLKQAERKSKEEFYNLLETLNNAKETYDLMNKKRELSKVNFQQAQERFDLGLISVIDFEDAQNKYLQSQLDVLKQYYNLILKRERLNVYLGKKILTKW